MFTLGVTSRETGSKVSAAAAPHRVVSVADRIVVVIVAGPAGTGLFLVAARERDARSLRFATLPSLYIASGGCHTAAPRSTVPCRVPWATTRTIMGSLTIATTTAVRVVTAEPVAAVDQALLPRALTVVVVDIQDSAVPTTDLSRLCAGDKLRGTLGIFKPKAAHAPAPLEILDRRPKA